MPDLDLTGASAVVFAAGDGQQYGLVSFAGSREVVVFRRLDEKWYGHVEFNATESTGLAPGEARPEVATLFAIYEKENRD